VQLVDGHAAYFKTHVLGEDGGRTAKSSQHARHKQARVEVSTAIKGNVGRKGNKR
jgi:hypothetical protein